jgi:TRAP-type transport system periplasmic protein
MGVGRRAFLASSLASVAAPAVARLARGEVPHVTLKLHHAESSVSCVHTDFLAPWAQKIEAQSNGRIRIDIFPSMALGGRPAELFDQTCDRLADIVWAMPSKTPGRFPRIETFELPFVPARRALVSSKALEDFAAAFLQDEFSEVRPLCFSCSDRGILHASRPIETRAEVRGLRLDVSTRFAGAAIEILGGHAVPMPSAQLPFAIARRVVDGCIMPWDRVPALKLDELLKAHTDFADYSLSSTTTVLAMNKTSYEELPADLKKIIDDNSGQLAAGMAGTMWDLKAKTVADTVSQSGNVVTLEPKAVAHWREAAEPVVGAWRKQMTARKIDGEKLLAGARTLIEKYANLPEPQPPQRPVEAKAQTSPPAKAGSAEQIPSAATPKVSVVTSGPHRVPTAPPQGPSTHWWEFWKSAPTPPSATASVTPREPSTHWWQFWKSASTPAPATASASATQVVTPAPAVPPPAVSVKPASVAPRPPPPKALNIPL